MKLLQIHQQPAIYLVLAALLLAIGIYGLLRRRTLIGMLISGEIIFAAAEVAVALSIIIAVYRNYRSITPAELNELKG